MGSTGGTGHPSLIHTKPSQPALCYPVTGAGTLNEASIAKQTPPRDLLRFAGRCHEDQKETPKKALGIP